MGTHHHCGLLEERNGGVGATKGNETRDEARDKQAAQGRVSEGVGAHKHILGRTKHLPVGIRQIK